MNSKSLSEEISTAETETEAEQNLIDNNAIQKFKNFVQIFFLVYKAHTLPLSTQISEYVQV